eukprot:PITA_26618
MVKVEDDRSELIYGLALEGQSEDSEVPPFYISLRLHEYVLHNAMFDSGASHNLMPKAIMEKLGLDITHKYHDLYYFDSNSGFNDIDIQLVEVEDVPDISENFIEVLDQERQKLESTFEQSAFQQQQTEEINQGKKEDETEFQHLEEKVGLWSMDFGGAMDLKVYNKDIIQHTIPIKPNQKPFHQKLRRINPKLLPSIEKEVNQLYKASIIVPIKFFDWISNLIPVRKKTEEIILCIDFRNLNKVSLKDNYLLPNMDHIL